MQNHNKKTKKYSKNDLESYSFWAPFSALECRYLRKALFSDYCLVWYRDGSIARCTCFAWAWKSHCVHIYAALQKWGVKEYVGKAIPTKVPKPKASKKRAGSSEEADRPKKGKRQQKTG